MGHFKAVTRRYVAIKAPYMGDGFVATMDAVVDHYAAGGRTIKDGPHAGVSLDNLLKSSMVPSFEMMPQGSADLITFLKSLTGETYLTNPKLSDPRKKEP